MNMSKQAYQAYVKEISPPSPLGKNMLCAFLVGGAICTVGQFFSNWYTSMDMGKDAASTAGTIIPISGFANSIVSPAMEFKSEGLILGLAAKMFVVAGPVLVYGILTSSAYGLVLFLIGWLEGVS